MNINELMETLMSLNVSLELKNGELSVRAPQGVLTTDIKLKLKAHKSTLVEILSDLNSQERTEFQIVPDRENLYEPFPLADLQEAFYMADNSFMEFQVRPHYYCEQDLDDMDIGRYEFAMNKALRRHKGEAVIITHDKQLKALKNLPYVSLKINDLTASSFEDAQINLLSRRQNYMRKELPLNCWPWFEIEVSIWLDKGKNKYRVHSNQNNFYTDGFGASLIQREIDALYENIHLDLPPLELSFRDAVLGLRKLADLPEGQRAKDYWLSRLPGLPEPPAIPLIAGVNRRCRSKLQRRGNALTAEQWTQFKTHAGQFGVTPTNAIITAYAEIISRWSGSRHFILSNMVTRRLPIHSQMRSLVGNFASLYPLEIDLRDDTTYCEKALQIQQQILRDSDHRQWGGMQVMQAFNRLKGEFGSVPCPFVIGSALFMGGYRKPDFSCLETSQTMLDHQFWEIDDGSLYYAWDLLEEFFPAGMINQMWDAYHQLLTHLATDLLAWQQKSAAIAKKSSAPISNIPIKIDAKNKLIHRNILDKNICKDESIAIYCDGSEYTYGLLRKHLATVVNALTPYDLKPNELVAIMMDRDQYLIAATLGILCSGAAYVPFEPKLPSERIEYLINNTATKIVLTHTKYADKLNWPGNVTPIYVDRLPLANKDIYQKDVSPNDLAYVIYTSGSTGAPKGVMIDHIGAINTILAINTLFAVNKNDIILGVSSYSFDLSVYDVFGAISAGATLVYPSPESAFNPAHWVTLINDRKITIWNSAPPLMSLLVETALRQNVTFPSLRLIMMSGDWIPVELPALIKKIAPQAKIVSLGGATEASIWSIYYPIESVDEKWISIPYGKALPNQGWKIRDSLGRDVPTWTMGDLYISGIGLAKGYWKDSEKTKMSFVIDAKTGEYLYKTGDLGRFLSDGNIEFMGRSDNQVKIQGHRIELGEVESAIRNIGQVKDVAVLAVENKVTETTVQKSRRDRQLVAYLVMDEIVIGKTVALTTCDMNEQISLLKETLAEKLPSYMIPTGWAFLNALPITSNGKIDRKSLIQHPLAGSEKSLNSEQVIAPRTPIEMELLNIWQAIINPSLAGVNQDFFEVGGNSFDAVRSLSVVQENLGVILSLADIWEARTIENIALRVLSLHKGESKNYYIALNKIKNGNTLHFIPPGGGQVVGYYPLGEILNCPCYAIPAFVEDIAKGTFDSVEKIAAFTLKKIRDRQKVGPYHLVGWSSGGAIAFELASQLEEQGHTVAQLIMLDSPAPMQHKKIDEIDMLKGFFEDLGLNLPVQKIENCYSNADNITKNFIAIVTIFNEHIAEHSSLSTPITNTTLDATQLLPIYQVFNANVTAIRNYFPKPIKADIVVIRALEGIVTEFADHPCATAPDWGWSELTTGSVFSHSVPGSHHTFLRTPNVIHVAKLLNSDAATTNYRPFTTHQFETSM
ncbi:MAG: amino acid adenylation domain-containing protein [Pseudomonadota bacterium]